MKVMKPQKEPLAFTDFNVQPWKPNQNSGIWPVRFGQALTVGMVMGLKVSFVIAVFVRSKFKLRLLSFSNQDAQK